MNKNVVLWNAKTKMKQNKKKSTPEFSTQIPKFYGTIAHCPKAVKTCSVMPCNPISFSEKEASVFSDV